MSLLWYFYDGRVITLMVNILNVLSELMSALDAVNKTVFRLFRFVYICFLAPAHDAVLETAPLQSAGSHADVIGTDAERAEVAESSSILPFSPAARCFLTEPPPKITVGTSAD